MNRRRAVYTIFRVTCLGSRHFAGDDVQRYVDFGHPSLSQKFMADPHEISVQPYISLLSSKLTRINRKHQNSTFSQKRCRFKVLVLVKSGQRAIALDKLLVGPASNPLPCVLASTIPHSQMQKVQICFIPHHLLGRGGVGMERVAPTLDDASLLVLLLDSLCPVSHGSFHFLHRAGFFLSRVQRCNDAFQACSLQTSDRVYYF